MCVCVERKNERAMPEIFNIIYPRTMVLTFKFSAHSTMNIHYVYTYRNIYLCLCFYSL